MALNKALSFMHDKGYYIVGIDSLKVAHNTSFSCEELIDELQEDIVLFHLEPKQIIRLYLEKVEGIHVFNDYEFDHDEYQNIKAPYTEVTVEDAVEILKLQNDIFD